MLIKNFKYVYISSIYDNKNLNTIIKHFGNSTVENCFINNVNILCYENYTCDYIYFNEIFFSNEEAGKYLKLCTKKEIDEFFNQKKNGEKFINQDNNKKDINSNSSFIFLNGIFLGCIIGILLNFVLIKKIISKRHNRSDLNSNDEFRNGNFRVILNNNDDNDANGEINNNNNINNSNNYENNNYESLDTKEPPPSYSDNNMTRNTDNKGETDVYNASIAEEYELPLDNNEMKKLVSKNNN